MVSLFIQKEGRGWGKGIDGDVFFILPAASFTFLDNMENLVNIHVIIYPFSISKPKFTSLICAVKEIM